MNNLLNILQTKEVPIENQQIIDYLQGQLQSDAAHGVEEMEQNDQLMQDAMEGLRMLKDTSLIERTTRELNSHLQQRVQEQKAKRKQTGRWKDQNWIMTSVVVMLLLIVICFLVIRVLHHP